MKLGRSLRGARLTVIVAVLVGLLALPALATARIILPPGATEGDQYFEEVPNGGGSASPNDAGTSGSGGLGGGPAAAATQQLNALGADGAAAAALANANRPPQGPGKQADRGSSSSPASSSTQGEGGMGIFFPLLLIGTVLAGAAFLVRRGLTPA